ncbi:hypothetical protein OIU77_007328 [Salix suchowensis]|uniref:Ubiquitin-like protease family profile domain-containing protein n=1 Tax=Salix suchowensis TaxID=1278906 RepID=A0ABQ9AFX0_9ROSI|nr:hypothetical protein OIU77_007328 [Salix suchowensis]
MPQVSSYLPSSHQEIQYLLLIDSSTEITRLSLWRGLCLITGAALSKLKAAVCSSVNGSHQPTRVEVVTAVMWKTLAMVARSKHGRSRPSLLSHTFNMRGKIAMPVPDNSCGNFINVALSHFTEDDGSKLQLHDFVDRVCNGIKKMVSDCAKVSSDDELFVMAEKIRIESII